MRLHPLKRTLSTRPSLIRRLQLSVRGRSTTPPNIFRTASCAARNYEQSRGLRYSHWPVVCMVVLTTSSSFRFAADASLDLACQVKSCSVHWRVPRWLCVLPHFTNLFPRAHLLLRLLLCSMMPCTPCMQIRQSLLSWVRNTSPGQQVPPFLCNKAAQVVVAIIQVCNYADSGMHAVCLSELCEQMLDVA